MTDTFTKAQRSRVMGAVRSKGTGPEMVVRRMVHGMGWRYRVHVRGLAGTPDLVFARLRKVIEVRGCFWHMHHCGACTIPATRRGFWKAKLARNKARDRRNLAALRRRGWKVLVVWECQVRGREKLAARLSRFLGG